MTRFACRLAYDGTAYHGFQRQAADRPTIQSMVETGLTHMTGLPVSVAGAGRTDSGVHASGQVIAFTLDWAHSVSDLVRALNAHLPGDIVVQSALVARDDFHPRYSATRRTYLYRILSASVPDPLRRDRVWHWWSALDVANMQTCLAMLIGEHDFATFGTPPRGTNTIRHVLAAHWEMVEDEHHFTISANAFLKRMVRSLVGTLVDVGRGRLSVAEFGAAFKAADRRLAGKTAPPQGLVLTRVHFDNEMDRLFENLQDPFAG